MFQASKYQEAIFDFVRNGSGNAVVTAVAGSGKSTTLKQLLNVIDPSATVLFVAFNSDAAKELKKKLQEEAERKQAAGEPLPTWDCRTIHSLGNGCLFSTGIKGDPIKGSNKYLKLARLYLQDPKNLDPNMYDGNYALQLKALIEKVRLTLSGTDAASLVKLVRRFELDLDIYDTDIWPVICKAVPAILEAGIELAKAANEIDFTDQIYLPHALGLKPKKFDWVLVDEAQDLSPAQRELVLNARHGKSRFIAVGDRNQAIYGFAGASLQSIDEIVTDAKAIELPLSICYRCGEKIINKANSIRPGTEAAPDAIEGIVENIGTDKISQMVQAGDLVLCRFTAPLVEKCLELLRDGKRANVRGKDLGASFAALIQKMQKHFKVGAKIAEVQFFMQLVEWTHTYESHQISILALNGEENEMAIASLQDKVATLICLYESYREKGNGSADLAGFLSYITEFFKEDKDAQIILSTGHRAKGLEYDRVFILKEDELPCSKAKTQEQQTQELNLMYVMYTRARQALYCVVASVPEPEKAEQPSLIDEMVAAVEQAEAIVAEPLVYCDGCDTPVKASEYNKIIGLCHKCVAENEADWGNGPASLIDEMVAASDAELSPTEAYIAAENLIESHYTAESVEAQPAAANGHVEAKKPGRKVGFKLENHDRYLQVSLSEEALAKLADMAETLHPMKASRGKVQGNQSKTIEELILQAYDTFKVEQDEKVIA